jgi:hypothetical protein
VGTDGQGSSAGEWLEYLVDPRAGESDPGELPGSQGIRRIVKGLFGRIAEEVSGVELEGFVAGEYCSAAGHYVMKEKMGTDASAGFFRGALFVSGEQKVDVCGRNDGVEELGTGLHFPHFAIYPGKQMP